MLPQDWHPSDHISFIDNVKLRKLSPDSRVGRRLAGCDWLILRQNVSDFQR